MAGYSQTPLLKKLGIRETSKIFTVDAPGDYAALFETDIAGQMVKKMEDADLFHVFAKDKARLGKHFNAIIAIAKDDAVIWVSWYKKSSQITTDVTEDAIRAVVLPTGWVDVKVCAVSDAWSGLKIVKRVQNRKK